MKLSMIYRFVAVVLMLLNGCFSPQKGGSLVSSNEEGVEARQETKIGVIDLLAVLKKAKIGEPARATWEREIQEATQLANAEWQKLQELQQPRGLDRWTAEQRVRVQYQQYVTYYKNYKDASKRGYKKALSEILPKVETVTKTVAERDDFSVVLDKGNPDIFLITLYAPPAMDITEQVIEELNRRFP
ncbi:MAG TPA: OmpH family outer membrane protein [Nitrospiraceae bacterium]|jgi:outer membrane protein